MKYDMKIALLPIGFALLLTSCVMQPTLPEKLNLPSRSPSSDGEKAIPPTSERAGDLVVSDTPSAPVLATKPPKPADTPPVNQIADVTLNFDSLPLPDFIQAVYATALKRNISIDPAVMAKKDVVTLRSGTALTPQAAEQSARMVLKSYGVAVIDAGVLTRFVPDNANTGYLPEIRRGRALPDSPLPLRPVFQLVELQAVRNGEIVSHLRTLFGEKLRFTEDPLRNALLLAGNGDDVQAAMEAIQVLDQPMLKGRNSIRLTPVIWSADELAKKLTEILTQEGYSVGTTLASGGVQYPITLLPVAGLNTVIVFSQSKEIANHIVEWAKTLDKPAEKSVGRNLFSYPVRNTDASRLAETVQQLLSGSPSRAPVATPVGATASSVTTSAASATASSNVVVDKATNTILFRANGEEYTDIIRLLRELDRTARQVLIEVTVAQVTLGNGVNVGVDWLFSKVNKSGNNIVQLNGNTAGASSSTPFAGFSIVQFDGVNVPRAVLNALADDSRATVLSTPRVIARNGEEANLQVGSQVPVLTSQQTNAATGSTGIIQTVQYRDTGTILKIKPVIHSSDQVDIDISQEISAVNTKAAGGISSPTIDKTSLGTKLTLKHGSTYILGGLITNNTTRTNSGVPFLKDIPILGYAFKKSSDTVDRTEMLIVITPYIISDDGEARAVTDAVRKQLGPWAAELKAPETPAPK